MFALLAALTALLSITAYAYEVKSFDGVASFISMALHTAVTSLVLALGLFFAREATPWGQLFSTPDAGGVVARRLFPLVIGLTLFLGWLRVTGERLGFYEAAFGTTVFAIVLCLLFMVVIRWTVWTLGKIDAQRDSLQRQLLEGKLELQEALQQSQLIIDHARELICTLNAKAELLTVNAACEEILSLPSRRLLGQSFVQLHLDEEKPQIEKAFAEARSGMIPETFSVRCRKGDQSYARLNWSIQWSPHFEKMFCVGRMA
jgi:PAS domain-containing protein